VARVLLFGRLSDVAGWRERQVAPLNARTEVAFLPPMSGG
jgi:molybdopterin converting factor small subunit